MPREYVHFPVGSLTLEGALELPDGSPGPRPGVVVCHPHPLYGGDMSNNVVKAVADALVKRGIVALRFNFRGVGSSGGRYADGLGEQDDVRGAVSFLLASPHVDPAAVGVAGYSFGAYVGLAAACAHPRVQAVAAISLPVRLFDFAFLDACAKPLLVVAGRADDFTSPEAITQLVAALPGPKRLVMEQADHFWFGGEQKAAQPVAAFFAESLHGAHSP